MVKILEACLFLGLAVLRTAKQSNFDPMPSTGGAPNPYPSQVFLASRVLQRFGSVCIRGVHGNED